MRRSKHRKRAIQRRGGGVFSDSSRNSSSVYCANADVPKVGDDKSIFQNPQDCWDPVAPA